MTNTRITDPGSRLLKLHYLRQLMRCAEIFERRYPVILREFSIREGSGGKGMHDGMPHSIAVAGRKLIQ